MLVIPEEYNFHIFRMRPKLCYKFLSKCSKGLPFSGFVRVFALEFVNIMKGSREKYENYIPQVLQAVFLLKCNTHLYF